MVGGIRDEVEGLHNYREFRLPTPRVFISGYANTAKKVFYYFYEITCPRKNAKLSFYQILTSREVLYTKLVRVSSSCFAKRCFSKYAFKMSAQAKKKKTQDVCKDFPSFSRGGPWVYKVNLSTNFST